jgi:hypothetical protein
MSDEAQQADTRPPGDLAEQQGVHARADDLETALSVARALCADLVELERALPVPFIPR